MEKFERLIQFGVKEGVSDIHISGGHPVVFRQHGAIRIDRTRLWSHLEVDDLVLKLLNQRELGILRHRKSVDLAKSVRHYRVRINVFTTLRGLSLAIRLLPGRVPNIDKLNLHSAIKEAADQTAGLILIGGATGSGKSTTIAGLVEEINRTKPAHVITLEDPIEYRFVSKRSFIEQRELGNHFPTFEQGLMDVLREDPDVIVVGELRDPETIRLTLNAVESGHLVIATLHASNPEDAIYRMCNSFPPEAQDVVRGQLASTLHMLVVQKLSYWKKLGFRVPVLSILRGTSAAKTIIRENKLTQIESLLQTSRGSGMFTVEKYVSDFLETKEDFTAPNEIFHASEEAADEESIYVSPLLDGATTSAGSTNLPRPAPQPTITPPPQAAPPRPSAGMTHTPRPAPSAPTAPPPAQRGASYWDKEGRYVIQEEKSIEDLIAEMENKVENLPPTKTQTPRPAPKATETPPRPSETKEKKNAALEWDIDGSLSLDNEAPLEELITEIRRKPS